MLLSSKPFPFRVTIGLIRCLPACLHVSLFVSLAIYPSLCLDCLIIMTEKIGKAEFSPVWYVYWTSGRAGRGPINSVPSVRPSVCTSVRDGHF